MNIEISQNSQVAEKRAFEKGSRQPGLQEFLLTGFKEFLRSEKNRIIKFLAKVKRAQLKAPAGGEDCGNNDEKTQNQVKTKSAAFYFSAFVSAVVSVLRKLSSINMGEEGVLDLVEESLNQLVRDQENRTNFPVDMNSRNHGLEKSEELSCGELFSIFSPGKNFDLAREMQKLRFMACLHAIVWEQKKGSVEKRVEKLTKEVEAFLLQHYLKLAETINQQEKSSLIYFEKELCVILNDCYSKSSFSESVGFWARSQKFFDSKTLEKSVIELEKTLTERNHKCSSQINPKKPPKNILQECNQNSHPKESGIRSADPVVKKYDFGRLLTLSKTTSAGADMQIEQPPEFSPEKPSVSNFSFSKPLKEEKQSVDVADSSVSHTNLNSKGQEFFENLFKDASMKAAKAKEEKLRKRLSNIPEPISRDSMRSNTNTETLSRGFSTLWSDKQSQKVHQVGLIKEKKKQTNRTAFRNNNLQNMKVVVKKKSITTELIPNQNHFFFDLDDIDEQDERSNFGDTPADNCGKLHGLEQDSTQSGHRARELLTTEACKVQASQPAQQTSQNRYVFASQLGLSTLPPLAQLPSVTPSSPLLNVFRDSSNLSSRPSNHSPLLKASLRASGFKNSSAKGSVRKGSFKKLSRKGSIDDNWMGGKAPGLDVCSGGWDNDVLALATPDKKATLTDGF